MHTYLFKDGVFRYVSGVVQAVICYFTVDMNYSESQDIKFLGSFLDNRYVRLKAF